MSRFPLPGAEPSASTHWATPGFLAEVRAFVEGAVGPVELVQHRLRGWSTVLTACGGEGLFWVKQSCRTQIAEAGLLDELGRLVPGRVVPLRAVDRERGLLLMPDQGPVHEVMSADLGLWGGVVGQWALLQREVAPHVAVLAATGVTSILPADALAMLDERAEAMNALPRHDLRRLPDAGRAEIRTHRDRVVEAVEVVGALGLPVTLNHNDLHGGNVFVGDGRSPLRFFDLGDALLAEPMAALLNPLNVLRQALGCGVDDPRLWRIAEVWIEVWSDLAPASGLRRALPHALRLARLGRHESWLRVSAAMTPQELAEWGSAAADVLVATVRAPLLGAPGATA